MGNRFEISFPSPTIIDPPPADRRFSAPKQSASQPASPPANYLYVSLFILVHRFPSSSREAFALSRRRLLPNRVDEFPTREQDIMNFHKEEVVLFCSACTSCRTPLLPHSALSLSSILSRRREIMYKEKPDWTTTGKSNVSREGKWSVGRSVGRSMVWGAVAAMRRMTVSLRGSIIRSLPFCTG